MGMERENGMDSALHRLGPHGRPRPGVSAASSPQGPGLNPPHSLLPAEAFSLSSSFSDPQSPERCAPPCLVHTVALVVSLFSHQIETLGESAQEQTRKTLLFKTKHFKNQILSVTLRCRDIFFFPRPGLEVSLG